jgi:hypothetical protein
MVETIAEDKHTASKGSVVHEKRVDTVIEKPVIEKIIEKQDVEVQKRQVIKEVIVQPIIEVERRVEYVYVPMPEGSEIWEVPKQVEPVQEVVTVEQTVQTTDVAKDTIEILSSSSKSELWGLSNTGKLFRLIPRTRKGMKWDWGWDLFPTGAMRFKDISVTKRAIFAIEKEEQSLVLLNTTTGKFEPVISTGPKLLSVSALSRKSVYAVGESGVVMHLDLKKGKGERAEWEMLGSTAMKKITVGSKHHIRKNLICGIGRDNIAYKWHEDKWTPIAGHGVRDVSVGVDNTIYAVSMDGQLLRFDDNAFAPVPKCFKDSNGQPRDAVLSDVTTYKRKHVYCTEQGTGAILRAVF